MHPGESVPLSSVIPYSDASTLFEDKSSAEKRPLPSHRYFHLQERWWAFIGVMFFVVSLILFFMSFRDPTMHCTRRLSAYCKSRDYCALTYSPLSLLILQHLRSTASNMRTSYLKGLCTTTPYIREPQVQKSMLHGIGSATVRRLLQTYHRRVLIQPRSEADPDIRSGPCKDRKETQAFTRQVPRRIRRGLRGDPGDRALHALSGGLAYIVV